MMSGKAMERIEYANLYYSQEGLSHIGKVQCEGYHWSERNHGFREDWDETSSNDLFLEQCQANMCFFGCVGRNTPCTDYTERCDLSNRGLDYDIDGGQDGIFRVERESPFARPLVPEPVAFGGLSR
jgi:hypothetical protein